MKWYGEPERIDADQMPDCEACDKECADCSGQTVNGGFATPLCPEPRGFELDELINFATIAANAAGHQLDPEETDAEFNAVLVDLDAGDASFLVDLMFYQLTGPLLGGAPKSSPAHPPTSAEPLAEQCDLTQPDSHEVSIQEATGNETP